MLTNFNRDLTPPLALSNDARSFVDKASQRLAASTSEPKPSAQSDIASSKTPAVVLLPNILAPRPAPRSASRADTLEANTLETVFASVRDVAIAEDVPLGTAISMTMQQEATESFPESSTESSTENFSTTLPNINLAQLGETNGEATNPTDLVATVLTEALTHLPLEEIDPLAELHPLLELDQTPTGLMAEQTLSSQPTLNSLIRSIPIHDSSPLVEQFQVAKTPNLK